jgi:hypothetical protein
MIGSFSHSEKYGNTVKYFQKQNSNLKCFGFDKIPENGKFRFKIGVESLKDQFYYELVEELNFPSEVETNPNESVGISIELHIEESFEFAKKANSFFEILTSNFENLNKQEDKLKYRKCGELGCIFVQYSCSLGQEKISSYISDFITRTKDIIESIF